MFQMFVDMCAKLNISNLKKTKVVALYQKKKELEAFISNYFINFFPIAVSCINTLNF